MIQTTMEGTRPRYVSWKSITTIGFVVVMIAIGALVAFLGILSLLIASPVIVYAAIKGRYLKHPWRALRRIDLSS